MKILHTASWLALVSSVAACSVTTTAHPEATVVSAPDGRALLTRAVEATGGVAAWRAVRTMEFELEATLLTTEREIAATSRILFRLPDEMYRGNVLEGIGEINMLIRGADAWFQGPGQNALAPAEPPVAQYLRAGLWRDLPFLMARSAAGGGPAVEWLREERIADGHRHVLRIIPPAGAGEYDLHVDAASGLPVMRRFLDGDDVIEDVFSDYRPAGGLLLPRSVRSYRNGTLAEDIVYADVRIDQPFRAPGWVTPPGRG